MGRHFCFLKERRSLVVGRESAIARISDGNWRVHIVHDVKRLSFEELTVVFKHECQRIAENRWPLRALHAATSNDCGDGLALSASLSHYGQQKHFLILPTDADGKKLVEYCTGVQGRCNGQMISTGWGGGTSKWHERGSHLPVLTFECSCPKFKSVEGLSDIG